MFWPRIQKFDVSGVFSIFKHENRKSHDIFINILFRSNIQCNLKNQQIRLSIELTNLANKIWRRFATIFHFFSTSESRFLKNAKKSVSSSRSIFITGRNLTKFSIFIFLSSSKSRFSKNDEESLQLTFFWNFIVKTMNYEKYTKKMRKICSFSFFFVPRVSFFEKMPKNCSVYFVFLLFIVKAIMNERIWVFFNFSILSLVSWKMRPVV